MRLGVISDPVITRRSIRPADRFMIIATQGLWKYLVPECAVEKVATVMRKFAKDPRRAERAAIVLIKEAMRFWDKRGHGDRDGIACTVVMLPVFGVSAPLPMGGTIALTPDQQRRMRERELRRSMECLSSLSNLG